MSEIVDLDTCYDCKWCVEKQKGVKFHERAGFIPAVIPYCTVVGKFMEDYSKCKKSFIRK